MKNKILDKKLIASKVYEISQLIEGLTIPNVACIFSSIIIDIVNSARSQGVDVSDFVIEWLESVIESVEEIDDESGDIMVN